MTKEDFRRLALELPDAVESAHMGHPDFRVGGKIFALSALDATPLSVSLKCEPELALRLRAAHPSITGGWHLNKRHWNTVTLDGSMAEDEIDDMVQDSYDLVAAKLTRSQRYEIGLTRQSAKRTNSN